MLRSLACNESTTATTARLKHDIQGVEQSTVDEDTIAEYLTKERLIGDLRTFGFLFEALCERDLRIYSQSFGANLLHYQDYGNDEIDAVVELADGSWSAFEIKLGAHQIDEAADRILDINRKFEHPATTLCIICGRSNAAYGICQYS
ncbi:MAG: DUF4143 domain-containing protein [Chlorobium sp.]|nr:DUF4143 domain-containing protein [Chlorobium sp.]